MTQDDRMETITDPEQIRAVWEAGDMGEESLGGDSESGTYNRSNRPPAGPRPDADNPWALLPDDHPERPKQCGGCGTKWVDAETAGACERRHGHDLATTPAPVGAAVAPNLDALHETICDKFTGMAEVRQSADLLVAEVRRLIKFRDWWKASSLANAEDVRRLTAICHDWRDRSEAAEAEVGTLRAKVAALQVAVSHSAESCADGPCEFHETVARAESAEAKVAAVEAVEDSWSRRTLPWPAWPHVHHWLRDLRAALATTGEVQ